MNVTTPIREAALRTPHAIAVILADHVKISTARLEQLIDCVGHRLLAAGLGTAPGQIVGLDIAGGDEFPKIVAALALARLGVASADTGFAPGRLAASLTQLQLDRLWAALPAPGEPVAALPVHADGSTILRYIGSSGTTGLRKVAAFSHAAMGARIAGYDTRMGGHGPVRIVAGGFGGSWGLRNLLCCLGQGATLVLTNPDDAAIAIRRHRVTGLSIAPISVQRIVLGLADNAVPPPDLRLVSVGGSTLPTLLRAKVRAGLCANLMARYGCMETGQIASTPMTDAPGYAGQLQDGVEVVVLDEHGQKLPHGEEGRLCYRTRGMVLRYEDDAALSAATFRDGWFQSGDIGRVSESGWLSLTGRDRDLINHGGVKVAPFVIEDVLMSIAGVTEAAAFGVPDRYGMERIWAAISATRPVAHAELTTVCRGRLGDRSPARIMQMPALPRNANGKVMLRELVAFAVTQQT